MAAIGCAVDYSLATGMKAKLQSAADAASVASISQKSPGYVAAAQMTGNGQVAAGVTDANNIFNGNMSAVAGFSNLALTSTVTKTGITLNVQFSANVPVVFMKVLGYQTLTVTGYSKATASLPPYLDFYLTLDVSGSMGLPSTSSEAVRMQSINPDNFCPIPDRRTPGLPFRAAKERVRSIPRSRPRPHPRPIPLPRTTSYTQQYNTNNACMGYAYSRVSQSALSSLISKASTTQYPKQVPGLPVQMLSGLPASLNTDPNFGRRPATRPAPPRAPTAASSCASTRSATP